jgi:dTDP-6-deoxy-L-talose 4-dehydrogenase (NAD+)
MIINHLLNQNHEVIATSRDIEKAKLCSYFNKVTYIPYDINSNSTENLYEFFQKPDSMIHVAWEKLNDYKDPNHMELFLKNHQNFISNLLSNGLKDFNGIGTCYECGLHEGELFEDCDTPPTLPYAEAKNELRKYVERECLKYHTTYKWIRIFYVFGEVVGRKNLYTLLKQAIHNGDKVFNMSGGEQIRDFLTPDEIAQTIIKISLQNKVQGIVNCCSGKPVKLKEFVQDFLDKNNFHIDLNLGYYPYPDYEPMVTWGNKNKLNQILNP